MKNARRFLAKARSDAPCLGTCLSLSDPGIAEALSLVVDFLWIDMEHSALSLESLKGHLMAMAGREAAALVRVPWNDAVRIKPVLDLGADGVIIPMVRTAADVAAAVAACRYPPEGIRGFGPLRLLDYGLRGNAPGFCDEANASVVVIVQIEHAEAVANIDGILAVPGLSSVAFGPMDLSGSMGLRGQPRHPDVLAAMETVIGRARSAGVPVGISIGDDPNGLRAWRSMGFDWIAMGVDVTLLLRAYRESAQAVLDD